jgi:hypothetical protein
MDKPYAIWHWQGGKPPKSFCYYCWTQNIAHLQGAREASYIRKTFFQRPKATLRGLLPR